MAMPLLAPPPIVAPAGLTDRWTPAVLSQAQLDYLYSEARINYTYAGRRSYKTEAAKRRLVRSAIFFSDYPDGKFYACAPTHMQAKDICWEDIKALVPDWAFKVNRKRSISEGELRIDLSNGAMIKVAGLDKPQRIEGKFWDGGFITEYAECKPDTFGAHILPMLLRGGWIDLESVPEGRNHFYKEVQAAKKELLLAPEDLTYGVHHWKTSEVLHLWLGKLRADAELKIAKGKLDPLTYSQEYDADFVFIEGRAYYQFNEKIHVRRSLPYDPRKPLILCFDFNVSPGVAAVAQETEEGTHWIGEVFIEQNSNTPMVCRKLITDWAEKHRGSVHVYGDATGGNPGSAKVQGSDWDLIRNEFRHAWQGDVEYHYGTSNPTERSRVNAMNTRMMTADGTVRMFFSGQGCPNLINDMEGVVTVKGGSGEIDKDRKKYKMLTHLSDGAGYYIAECFPTLVRESYMEQI